MYYAIIGHLKKIKHKETSFFKLGEFTYLSCIVFDNLGSYFGNKVFRYCCESNLKTEISLWKCIKCFPFTILRNNFKNATIIACFGFVFEGNSDREIRWLKWLHPLRRAPFSNVFLFTPKQKAVVFKFLLFVERFRTAPFSWRISVNGRPNRRNKTSFPNFSVVLWPLQPKRYGAKNYCLSSFDPANEAVRSLFRCKVIY